MNKMQQSPSDAELAIRQIFNAHFHHLVLAAFRYVNDYGQAEDIVQDVFVKLWQNFDEYKQLEDLKGYLFKAVKNSSKNFLRHANVKQKFVTGSEVLNPSTQKSHEEAMSDDEVKRRIHQAVNKLPENWRQAFILSKYDNLKYREIAEVMKISQKTVEKYISKALQFLRQDLKDVLLTGIIILGILFKNIFHKL